MKYYIYLIKKRIKQDINTIKISYNKYIFYIINIDHLAYNLITIYSSVKR